MADLVEHKLIETVQIDVCDPESITKARARVEELTGGRLDYLINNAGIVSSRLIQGKIIMMLTCLQPQVVGK